jgi:hypothetical protein
LVDRANRIYEIEYVGGIQDVPTIPRGLEQFLDTSDDNLTVSESDIVSQKTTEKAGESISDGTDGTDGILQNQVGSIPLPQERREVGRGVKEYEARWTDFLKRTENYHISYKFADDDLRELYAEDEMGQLQRDLKDWEKDGRVFYKTTKKKDGWRVTDRGAPEQGGSK